MFLFCFFFWGERVDLTHRKVLMYRSSHGDGKVGGKGEGRQGKMENELERRQGVMETEKLLCVSFKRRTQSHTSTVSSFLKPDNIEITDTWQSL